MSLKTKADQELLAVCREHSGEYLAAHHPSTSFATQYSDTFVEAAAELLIRFEEKDRWSAVNKLYVAMRDAQIQSCRGGPMTFSKVEYLVKGPIGSYRYKQAMASQDKK